MRACPHNTMSSPHLLPPSPGYESVSGRHSKFTYKQLAHLAASSTCPLRVIAHIDLDAFYAQCEMVRLGVPEDQPLAVQQWYASQFDLSFDLSHLHLNNP